MSAYARERAAERIAELSSRGHDLITFWRGCTDVLEAAFPITTSRAGTRSTRRRF